MIGGLIWMLFAALSIGAAATVAFSKNILHCAFGLLGTLVGVCAFYIFLGADFLAMTQVVVYVGGYSEWAEAGQPVATGPPAS